MDDFLTQINREIDRKIDIMEADDYEGVPPIQKKDAILPAVLFVVCLIVMVAHYYVL